MPYFKNYEHSYFFTHKSTPLSEQESKAIRAMYNAEFGTDEGIIRCLCTPTERCLLCEANLEKADESVRLALLFNIPLEEAEVI